MMKAILVVFAQCASIKAYPIDPASNHQYSLNSQITVDTVGESVRVEGETEATNFYHHDMKTKHISDKAPVSLFFHGGNQASSSFVAMSECAFMPRSGDYEIDEDEDDDDDDDDDQDDGSSSMLSNSSVRRSVAVSGGEDDSYRQGKKGMKDNSSSGLARPSSMLVNNLKTSTTRKAYDPLLLNVRGGAQMSDEFAKRLITAALVTLMYEGSMGHIFEFLKIAMQTAEPGTSYADIIKSITSQKGIGGLWDGFLPWGVIQSIMKGGVFGLAHAMAKSQLTPLVDKNILPELLALTLAGGIAGGFQGYVLSPTLLLKTRVMTNPVFRMKMSLLKTTMLSFAIGFDVVKNEGVGALMKGANIFATKRVFDWSTRFFFSDMFESIMLGYGCGVNGKLSPSESMIASLLGGTASTIVTLPLDVIVAKSQDAKKAGVKTSAWDTFMKDYREGGFKQLYDANMQGFEARLVHVCMTTVVMKTGSGLMYNKLFGEK